MKILLGSLLAFAGASALSQAPASLPQREVTLDGPPHDLRGDYEVAAAPEQLAVERSERLLGRCELEVLR